MSPLRRVSFGRGIGHAMERHLTGSGASSLKTLDPGGTLSKWVGHVVQTAATGQGAARTIAGGEIMEILAPMAREAGGSLNIGVRLFRATGDEAWNLTTILTRQ